MKNTIILVLCGVIIGLISAAPLAEAAKTSSYFIGAGKAGQGMLFLFNPQGITQAQLGAYDAGAEKGQTLFGLHDRAGSLRFLTRVYGPDDSPVIVMKGKNGSDKILIGLEGNDETPYIRYQNSSGAMVDLINQ